MPFEKTTYFVFFNACCSGLFFRVEGIRGVVFYTKHSCPPRVARGCAKERRSSSAAAVALIRPEEQKMQGGGRM